MFPDRIAARLLLVWLAVLSLPAQAAPATRAWIGKEDPFWSNPGNWTNGLVPVAGDSIEFLDDVKFRDTYNDLSPDMTIGSILIKGRNYVLRGNRINLQDNLVSQPSNSSNRITLGLNINGPLSIINYGYFNTLELAGRIDLFWHPLVLETGSSILISGLIWNTNDAIAVIQKAAGTVSFGPSGRIAGNVTVEQGELNLSGRSATIHLDGPTPTVLVVGNDENPPGSARVVWGSSNKADLDTLVTVNHSGRLDLNGFAQTIASLGGSGVVDLDSGQLMVRQPPTRSKFAGELRGSGTIRLEGVNAGLELSGHNSFTGTIHTASILVTNQLTQQVTELGSHLILSGSASNAAVNLLASSLLTGNGAARSLSSFNATIRPGPGAMRFLESCTLEGGTRLELDLDGPGAGSLQALQLNLANGILDVRYQGTGPESLFTLIAAIANPGSTFQGLAEGAWIVAGDPAAPNEFRLTYSGNGGHDVVLERTGLFVPPALSIRLSGAGRVIEWPVAAQGYSLQRALTLDPPGWTSDGLPVTEATATEFFIIDDSSEGERFYRLAR